MLPALRVAMPRRGVYQHARGFCGRTPGEEWAGLRPRKWPRTIPRSAARERRSPETEMVAMGTYFGTDGIRGVAGDLLTPEFAAQVGRAAAVVVGRKSGPRPLFLIGRDTRTSGPMLEAGLTAGLTAGGAVVEITGVLPTPALAMLVPRRGAAAGSGGGSHGGGQTERSRRQPGARPSKHSRNYRFPGSPRAFPTRSGRVVPHLYLRHPARACGRRVDRWTRTALFRHLGRSW